MATIVFSAIGTAVGGPLGGALGALVGNQVDQAVIGSPSREGPRLKELAVTTSSYGTPIARHFGRMRAPGIIIWATDLVENSESTGGGKGRPSTTAYTYAANFAVALASRPISGLGRIWANGNLLRGQAGDLKVGGTMRLYSGRGDQPADPLILADKPGGCPAFRGLAYCVFENLQLADFGNRIPAMTFEVIADDGTVSLADMVAPLPGPVESASQLPGLLGYSDDGGPLASSLANIGQVYPLDCDAAGARLSLRSSPEQASTPPLLPEAVADPSQDGFAPATGQNRRRRADAADRPDGLRYYDKSRDYQAGLQRADGRAGAGRRRTLDFPGTLTAEDARYLANRASERASWAHEVLSWRIAELDPALAPGGIVRVPGKNGIWRIENWEWRDTGVELELRRLPNVPATVSVADAGASLSARDLVATETILNAFELPWDGQTEEAGRAWIAVSSTTRGWRGAALYAAVGGELEYLQPSGERRAVMGVLASSLRGAPASVIDRQSVLEVSLASEEFALSSTSMAGLAAGENRALVGEEILQFAGADYLGGATWRLSGLLRGRGGTEASSLAGHETGSQFVLLNKDIVPLSRSDLPPAARIAAIGLADQEPVLAPIVNDGAGWRPPSPVHPRLRRDGGEWLLSWTRRARGAWVWSDATEVPLHEETERYQVGIGAPRSPTLVWNVFEPCLRLSSDDVAMLENGYSGRPLWVRQVGSRAISEPCHLTTIS